MPSTALMAASREGHTEIVKLLIDAGADVNYWVEAGYTALKWEKQTGHIDSVRLLLEVNAK